MDESSQSSSDSSPSNGAVHPSHSVGRRELSARHLSAAKLESQGATISQIAKTLGVSSRSVERWRANPKYRAEVRRCVHEASRSLDRMALAFGPKAIKALSQIISDPSAKPGERASAAQKLADIALKISARTTEAEADREAEEEERLSAVRPPRNLTFALTKPVLPESNP